MSRFKLYQQLEMSDCGPACIQMVCAYYDKEHSLQSIKKEISVSRIGVTVGDVKRTCEKFGLFTLAVRGTVEQTKGTVLLVYLWSVFLPAFAN